MFLVFKPKLKPFFKLKLELFLFLLNRAPDPPQSWFSIFKLLLFLMISGLRHFPVAELNGLRLVKVALPCLLTSSRVCME